MPLQLRTSVGRRLLLLVVSQTAIAALLIFLALRAFGVISDELRYIHEFHLPSIAETGAATKDAADLRRLLAKDSQQRPDSSAVSTLIGRLMAFSKTYRTLWQSAHGDTAYAIRFRNELMRTGDEILLAEESRTLRELEVSLKALAEASGGLPKTSNAKLLEDTLRVKDDLYALHDLNVRYAELSYQHISARVSQVRTWLLTLGILGAALTLLLGLYVHRAIAPRVRRLVHKIQKFREFGVNEKIIESGRDEIAILANALDAGFAAISEREREREEFLAIAAHELKTPITSIHGYSKLLLDYPERTSLAPRALEIIHRQSWRLSRLVEHLFLAMRAKVGELKFHPQPLDFSALVQRVQLEVRGLICHEALQSRLQSNIGILGDEALLQHALWSLFTSACALSQGDKPVNVVLDTSGPYARLTVDIESALCAAHEIETLFTPFQSVQYEDGSGIRAGVGLYLCREIVRLHNGQLRVSDRSNVGPRFSMELAL